MEKKMCSRERKGKMEMRGRERKPEGIDSQKKCKRITGKKKRPEKNSMNR